MALSQQQLPCDGDGVCMLCNEKPSEAEKLVCKTCVTPWHVDCLSSPPETMSSVVNWECPDCSPVEEEDDSVILTAVVPGVAGELIAKIRAIEADKTLSDSQKAMKRQELLSGGGSKVNDGAKAKNDNEILEILGENIKCSFCMQLPDRPVTTPCGHNFCLKCFEKWVGQGKKTCAKCRVEIPSKVASQPRINASLVFAIRMARTSKPAAAVVPRVISFVHNNDLPDEAFTTERAKKAGKANAKSGRIFVTIPNDYLGPITAEYDPVKNMGVLVGDCWADRLACRQWGAHFPHVSGIAGQSNFGAQSVVLSGGYEDDEDHGEWFLYTGSGGRDLSGNKRTSKIQTSDQKFTNGNEALRTSCRKGYPVRVVRSFKERRSNYAPEAGVRYDGIYRIEKCWTKYGTQVIDKVKSQSPYKVCRYLFVRCDNSPAPWTSDEHGDRPRPLPNVPELKQAMLLTERKESPHWDFDVAEGCWKWIKPPPLSKLSTEKRTGGVSARKQPSKAKIMKGFSCQICRKVLTLPITTPCAHNFCKSCLDGVFEGQKFVRERKTGGRSLRAQKTVMKCPSCTTDISECVQNAQINRELMGVIESLMQKFEEKKSDGEESGGGLNPNEESLSEGMEISSSETEENEIKLAKKTVTAMEDPDEVKPEPSPAKKRGRPSKNGGAAAVNSRGKKSSGLNKNEESLSEGTEISSSESEENEIKSVEKTDTAMEDPDEVKTKPSPAKKRGRPRKNGAAPAVSTRGRKSRRVADDGNDSPSSPLHVRSDNEL